MNILISPVRTWEAWCDCGWCESQLDRELVIQAARVHRREEHEGQCDIRNQFRRGTAEIGTVIAPALKGMGKK